MRLRRRLRGRLSVLVLAALAAVLAGCQVRVATDVVVGADGGGEVTVTIVVDEELREAMTDAGIELHEGLADAAAAATWDVTELDAPQATGVELSTTFATPDELGTRVAALSSALTPDDGALLRDVELRITEDGGYEFSASAGIDPPRIVGALPLDEDAEAVFDGDDLAQALREAGDELARHDLRVTFPTTPVAPGAVVEHSSATWQLPVDGLDEVSATAPPVPVTTALILASAAGIAAFVLVAFAVRAMRRR